LKLFSVSVESISYLAARVSEELFPRGGQQWFFQG